MPWTFNPFTNNFDYYALDSDAGDLRYLKLDQTTPQTTTGTFTFPEVRSYQVTGAFPNQSTYSFWLNPISDSKNMCGYARLTGGSYSHSIEFLNSSDSRGIHGSVQSGLYRFTLGNWDTGYAGYFMENSLPGRSVTLCDGTYAINSIGDINFNAGNVLTTGTIGTGKLTVTTDEQTSLSIVGTIAGYKELNLQNLSSAAGASSDLVMTSDTGTASTRFLDIGVNGSGGGAAPFTTALEGYLYHVDQNIRFGAIASGKSMYFYAGDATTARLTISSTGLTLGTDLAVTEGGTGRSSHSAYSLIAGGTTSTNAQQSIANSATLNIPLVSKGISVVPGWAAFALPPTITTSQIWYASSSTLMAASANFTYDTHTVKIIDTTTSQLRLGYSTSIYSDFGVSSDGNLTISTTGGSTGDVIINPTGSGTPAILSDAGSMIIGGNANTYNEKLAIDFETTANTVSITTTTGVTNITFAGMDLSILSDTLGLKLGADSDILFYSNATGVLYIKPTVADTDLTINYYGTTNSGVEKWMEDEGYWTRDHVTRTTTSLYRRYYHIPLAATNPGASGATWTSPDANTTGGWNLTLATHILEGQTDVHGDWDGASDPKFELRFATNVDNTGGAVGDTVDLKLVIYYKGIGDTATKTQTVEVSTVIGQAARYKQFKVEFPLNWDEASNVLDVGDVVGFKLNLETDTSEVDDIILADMSFSYLTTHTYIENGDE